MLTAFMLAPLMGMSSPGAQEPPLPLPGERFHVAGRPAFVIPPQASGMHRAVPWVWYAPTLPGLPGPEEKWMFERFTRAGIAVAGIDVGESYGNPAGRKLFTALYTEMVKVRGFSPKPILLGRSRGGLMTMNWAAENPRKVGGFAGIYPVLDLANWPGLPTAAPAYGLTPDELATRLTAHNPVDRLAGLARAGVPLFALHGDLDQITLTANSQLMLRRYEALGGRMRLVVAHGQAHSMWQGYFQCRELVDFVIGRARRLSVEQPAPVALASVPVQRNPLYARLASGVWQVRPWAERPFTFLSYAGDWSKSYQRFAHECKVQGLLTPTWEDAAYPHPLESAATEWGWSVEPQGATRRECYDWMRRYYLEKIAPAQATGRPFYSLTGHGFYSVYGAQWGCDMLGLETGENILGMQAQIAFLRGAARQNRLPFYVQPSQWFGGTVPTFAEGEEEGTPHPQNEAEVLEGISKGGIAIPNGGHSSSLLSRMWHVAWLAGAAIVCPEACQSIFFTGDQRANEALPPDRRMGLSPIGKRAQGFMRLTGAHPDRGVPYTPIAVMLDQYAGFNGFQLTQPRPWGVLKPTLGDRETSLFFNTIFPRSLWLDVLPGVDDEREQFRLVRSPYGDTVDVLLSNASDDVMRSYPALALLGDQEFQPDLLVRLAGYLKAGGKVAITHAHAAQLGDRLADLRRCGTVTLFGLRPDETPAQVDTERWLTPAHWGADAATLARRKEGSRLLPYEARFVDEVHRLMKAWTAALLPVRVSGDAEYLVNRTATGWVIGLVNNQGVSKGIMSPVRVDPTAAQAVTVKLRSGEPLSAVEWCTGKPVEVRRGSMTVEVPPGEVRVLAVTGR